MGMQRLFTLMHEKKASDLFMAINSPIHLKINGTLLPINQQRMDDDNIQTLLHSIVGKDALHQLNTKNELNVGISAEGIGRFRLSAFKQRGATSAVFRYVPSNIPKLSTLHLPPVLSELIMDKRGLVLLVGATGSGKSTTIASMLDYRNEVKTGHILTIEDPIEYTFQNKKSIVNQREIGTDADDLKTALKNSLRQAPDCILIGEIRDLETMMAAIAYSQSGHLVLATLHANNSYQALNRIVSFFPIENRSALLLDLASSIKAVISQRLIRSLQGGRVPAIEIMLNTKYVSELIEKGDIFGIKDAIEKSLAPGSQTFEFALMQMIQNGIITEEEGLANADSANNLMWLLNNAVQEQKKKEPEPVSQEATFTEFSLSI